MIETDLVPEDFNYSNYIFANNLNNILDVDAIPKDPSKKVIKSNDASINPDNLVPFAAEFDDLSRLHFIARDRKVSTILEFGVGKSTIVLSHALSINKKEYKDIVINNFRKNNTFQIYSVENYKKWIKLCKEKIKDLNFDQEITNFHFSKLVMSDFCGRICTFYETLPNISPDLIYLDGPDQYSPIGDIRGISTRNSDRFPMAADIISIEHFLHPGTLVIVDGRTANARFLKSNFQRKWSYFYSENWDQHYFELSEEPLGKHNKALIDFCLGNNFYKRITT